MSKDTTGPAFPCDRLILDGQAYSGAGLSKREYFAAMAMQGFAADPSITVTREQLVKAAVNWADALITELQK